MWGGKIFIFSQNYKITLFSKKSKERLFRSQKYKNRTIEFFMISNDQKQKYQKAIRELDQDSNH